MRIRLYMDEDALSNALIRALRAQDIEVVTASEVGMLGEEDEQHLKYAASQGLTLYSYNKKDYMALHTALLRQGFSHAGIILCQQNLYSVGEQMRRLLEIIGTLSDQDIRDQALFLSNWG